MSLCSGLITCSGILEIFIATVGALIGGLRMYGRGRRTFEMILLGASTLFVYPVSIFLFVWMYHLTGFIIAVPIVSIVFVWVALGILARTAALRTDSARLRFLSGLSFGAGAAWVIMGLFVALSTL